MVCCVAQIVTLGSQLQEYTTYNVTGIDDPSVSIFFSVSRHLTDVIVYTTILLLSLGFSLTRDQLTVREIRLGSGVIFLYIVLGKVLINICLYSYIYIYKYEPSIISIYSFAFFSISFLLITIISC
jgi:hypothetical protein